MNGRSRRANVGAKIGVLGKHLVKIARKIKKGCTCRLAEGKGKLTV